MTSPAKTRRENQPIPTTADAAAARFKCEAYLCTMEGVRCRDQHVHAAEFKPMHRDACIDCPAGEARAILLGRGGGEVGKSAICREQTNKGQPCANPPVEDGLCRIHRPRGAKKETVQMPAKKKAPVVTVTVVQEKKPKPVTIAEIGRPVVAAKKPPAAPKAPPPAPEEAAPPAPPPVEALRPVEAPPPVLVEVEKAEGPAECARSGCGRPAHAHGRLSDFCRQCGNSAYMTLKKGLKRTPTDDERREWLEKTPVNANWRAARDRKVAGAEPEAAAPATPRASKYHAAGIDWDAQPLGKISDTELGERLGVSATAVRHQRKKRGVRSFTPGPSKSKTFVNRKRMPRHKARAAITDFLCTTLKVKLAPGFTLVEAGLTDWAFCILPEQDRISHIRADRSISWNGTAWLPGADDPQPAPAAEQPTAAAVEPTAIGEHRGPTVTVVPESCTSAGVGSVPDHLVAVTFTLNRRAFAELERMAQAGLHGDDPCDAARTLVLDGLRRYALVRP